MRKNSFFLILFFMKIIKSNHMNENCQPNLFQIRNYAIERKIGTGAFSCVYKAKHLITNMDVAIKIIPKKSFPENIFLRELSIMKKIMHPFCVTLYEYIEDENNYYLIIEYIEGKTLLDLLNNTTEGSPEYAARHFFCQLISALDYLHNICNFIHRDLKVENIMIDRYNNIRLIDFGLGNSFDPKNPLLKTACGSTSYAAPELFCGIPYTTKIDVWSAGIILYALLCGSLPFEDKNTHNLIMKIINDPIQFPSFVKPEQRDLIIHMLDKNQDNRYTIEQVKNHPWFQNYCFSNYMDQNFGTCSGFCTEDNKINIVSELLKKSSYYNIDEDKIKIELKNEVFGENSSTYRIILRDSITCKLIAMYSKNKNASKQIGPKSVPSRFSPQNVLGLYPPKSFRSSSPAIDLKGHIKASGSFDMKKTIIKNRKAQSPIRVPVAKRSTTGSFLMSVSSTTRNYH